MFRKRISCMCAGLLFLAGIVIFAVKWGGGHKILFWSAVTMIIVGLLWLWDEIRDLGETGVDIETQGARRLPRARRQP